MLCTTEYYSKWAVNSHLVGKSEGEVVLVVLHARLVYQGELSVGHLGHRVAAPEISTNHECLIRIIAAKTQMGGSVCKPKTTPKTTSTIDDALMCTKRCSPNAHVPLFVNPCHMLKPRHECISHAYLLPPLHPPKPIIPSAAETRAPLTSSQPLLGKSIVICMQLTSKTEREKVKQRSTAP